MSKSVLADAVDELSTSSLREHLRSKLDVANPDIPKDADEDAYKRFLAERRPSSTTRQSDVLRDWVGSLDDRNT
jgi:hypothetical protein